jgi:hypothetical protein
MDLDLGIVRRQAEYLVDLTTTLSSNEKPEKKGGFLVLGLDNFSTKHILEIGECNQEKLMKYWEISQEKAHRLYSAWLRDPTSVLSWQTRDPENRMWGGAVLFPFEGEGRNCNIISFSGLTEAADEAVSSALGYDLSFGNMNYMAKVAAISDNAVSKELLERGWLIA